MKRSLTSFAASTKRWGRNGCTRMTKIRCPLRVSGFSPRRLWLRLDRHGPGGHLRQTEARSGTFQCDNLTFTNADNLGSPYFVPVMLQPIARDDHDLVASRFVSHYPFPAERSTSSFDGILASKYGYVALRFGEAVEFVPSERFHPWCVDLGSFMLIAKSAGKSKHWFRHRQTKKRPHGGPARRIIHPNCRS